MGRQGSGPWWKWRMQAALLLSTVLPVAPASGTGDDLPMVTPSKPRLYDITTETGMPHLEESLRYATVRQRRCLDPADLSNVFWMLDDVSLRDCRLEKTAQAHDGARYDLRCDGGHGTTGGAQWQFEPEQLRGRLDVKLGGKNMTFYQRVVARAVPSAPPARTSPDLVGGAGLADGLACSLR